MKEFFDRYIIILWIFCIVGLLIFVGHYSNILIDFGREVYYPEQILSGKILYKDLFNIYGPLSYQLNALLYKVFSPNLLTLYITGSICAITIVTLIYKLSKQFLSKFLSFAIAFYTTAIGIWTTSIFNFHFPYSWAVVYGLITFLCSLLFLLKYKDTNQGKFLILSSLFAGISVALKYDFILYSLFVLFFTIKNKNFKAFLGFFTVPLISYGLLFLQGLSINDLINSGSIYTSMAKSQTLKYFYQNSGVYFHPRALLFDLVMFVKFSLIFGLFILGALFFSKKKIISIILMIVSLILSVFLFNKDSMFGFLPILTLILAIINFKKLDSKLLILLSSALLVCVKVFWVLLVGSYGTYYISVLLILFFVLLYKHLPQKSEKFSAIFLVFISTILLINGLLQHSRDLYPISTPKGKIYTNQDLALSTNDLIEYLNTLPEGEMVVFPEGMMINFLTNRKSDDFYNSLLPLYIESFGENNIIEYFKKTKPQYIVLNNQNMKDYYYNYICEDYGLEFCAFVRDNYELINITDNNFRYLLFLRR